MARLVHVSDSGLEHQLCVSPLKLTPVLGKCSCLNPGSRRIGPLHWLNNQYLRSIKTADCKKGQHA